LQAAGFLGMAVNQSPLTLWFVKPIGGKIPWTFFLVNLMVGTHYQRQFRKG
jgi:hypothetical protein